VGPGDSLSIDLWGGITTRLVRAVDREGRVALPEAGPVQVSGHSLAEVQQVVQKAVGSQFRGTLGGCFRVAPANRKSVRCG